MKDQWRARTREQRRTRPRSKLRPAHAGAVTGFVVAVDRGRYTVQLPQALVTGVKARELGRVQVVVGDRVDLVGDTSGETGTLARIVRVGERRTVLRRTADDTDPSERVVVANADQLVIVVALADPQPRTGMVDRLVAAGYAGGLDVLLALTKADLVSEQFACEFTQLYQPAGVNVVVLARADTEEICGLSQFAAQLSGRTSVLVGHSGVGKSTLVNSLVPGANRATGHVNEVTGRGRHTSSSAIGLQVDVDTWVIDTPGVRSFGLAHVTGADILAGFSDVAAVVAQCPRGCTHAADAPDCDLDPWCADDTARSARVASLRRLLAAQTDTSR